MKIAVAYNIETENVFPHFGHAQAFKFFEVDGEEMTASDVVTPEGQGHAYMINLMKENGVEVVLCGKIGSHALEGLKEEGIKVYVVPEVPASMAVKAYASGALEGMEADSETCGDGGHCCGGEEGGSGCGGCHGGCHQAPEIIYEGVNAGKTVSVHYRGTLNDGTQFDSSYDRGEPLTFTCGAGQMIKGFDLAVINMKVGEEVDIHLMPEEAYGEFDPHAVLHFEIAQLPGSENLEVGQRVYLRNQYGQPFPVVVTEKDDTNIVLDANHELAGKELNFHIEVVSIED